MSSVVHLVHTRTSEGITTACHQAFKFNPRAAADVLPVTIWTSEVTCPACSSLDAPPVRLANPSPA